MKQSLSKCNLQMVEEGEVEISKCPSHPFPKLINIHIHHGYFYIGLQLTGVLLDVISQ